MDKELSEHVMIERVEMIARLMCEAGCQEKDREIALGLIAELAKRNSMEDSSFFIEFHTETTEG